MLHYVVLCYIHVMLHSRYVTFTLCYVTLHCAVSPRNMDSRAAAKKDDSAQ